MKHRTDAELIELLATDQAHEAEAVLFERYKKLASDITRSFTVVGTEPEDLESEAWLKLIRAIREYDATEGTSLKTWVRLTVTRHLMDLYESANRGSVIPRRLTLSLDRVSDSDTSFEESLPGECDVLADVLNSIESENVFRCITESGPILTDLMEGVTIEAISQDHDIEKATVLALILIAKLALQAKGEEGIAKQFLSVVRPHEQEQDEMFDIAEYVSEESRSFVAAAAYSHVRALFYGVLRDTAVGENVDDIVAKYGITRLAVESIMNLTGVFLKRSAA